MLPSSSMVGGLVIDGGGLRTVVGGDVVVVV